MAAVADTIVGLTTKPWIGPIGPFPPELFPYDLTQVPSLVGYFLEVELSLHSDDGISSPLVKGMMAQSGYVSQP